MKNEKNKNNQAQGITVNPAPSTVQYPFVHASYPSMTQYLQVRDPQFPSIRQNITASHTNKQTPKAPKWRVFGRHIRPPIMKYPKWSK